MVKGNNMVPRYGSKKDWQKYIKCWFEQPARKVRRRLKRDLKAKKEFPRPADGPLRPVARSMTQKYNDKVRAGRGFSLDELKEAGIPSKMALSIGIAVDHRRKNRSIESLQTNVARLKEYKQNLLLFPRRTGTKVQPAKGIIPDSAKAALKTADQLATGKLNKIVSKPVATAEYVDVTAGMKGVKAYQKLRVERMNVRQVGARKKAADEAAREAADKAKMNK